MAEFDPKRAFLRGPNLFPPLHLTGDGAPLSESRLAPDTEIFLFERNGQRRAIQVKELHYPHVAQGTLDGEPFLLSFCPVCNGAVGMDPRINGRVHHFSAGGLYNGMALLADEETATYWDHITGEAVHGELTGARLDTFPVEWTTVASALRRQPDVRYYPAPPPVLGKLMAWASAIPFMRNRLPPGFRRTMDTVDPRLPELEVGLGVVDGAAAKFYPKALVGDGVDDTFNGRKLVVRADPDNGFPYAEWADGTRPMQWRHRWYAFSLTYPECELYAD